MPTVIRQHADFRFSYYRLDTQGRVLAEGTADTAADLPDDLDRTNLAVMLSGVSVSLFNTKLPKLSPKKLLRSIPYILEDRLVTNVDALFFGMGEVDDAGQTPVAVIEIDRLRLILSELAEAGFYPVTILPDTLALNWEAGNWTVVFDGDIALVRCDHALGFAVDHENLLTMLQNAQAEAAYPTPRAIRFLNTPNTFSLDGFSSHLTPIKIDAITEIDSFNYFEALEHAPINLAQGEFHQRRVRTTKRSSAWRVLAWTFGAFLVALFGAQLVEVFFLSQDVQRLHRDIQSAYRLVYPGEKVVSGAKARMTHTLIALNHTATGNRFIRLMRDAGVVLKNMPRVRLQALSYQDQTLMITVQAPSLSTLESLSAELAKKGLMVQQKSLKTQKKFTTATLEIGGHAT